MDGMIQIASTIHLLFVCYTGMLFIRVISSWFPREWQYKKIFRFLAFYTDPYLNVFRRILPPLGGVLDLSPIIAFFVLKFLELFLLGFFR